MKQTEIIQYFKSEFNVGDIDAINKLLKSKDFQTKFRITGPADVHYGFTGMIKAINDDGVKVFDVNRVRLIRFDDIETFGKAKPKEPRKVYDAPKPIPSTVKAKKVEAKLEDDFEDEDDDYDNDDDFDEFADEEDDVVIESKEEKKFKPETTHDGFESKNQKKKPMKKQLGKKGSGSLFIPKKK